VRRRRQLIAGVAVLVALVLGDRAASACKHRGKLLFTETTGPVAGAETSVPDTQLEIYTSGAWGRVEEMPEGQEPASQGGCLSKRHLAELVRAVKRARWKLAAGASVCDAVSTVDVVYASPMRRKQVATQWPCGPPVDDATARAVACAELALSSTRRSGAEIRAICRGAP
jgi:hypothetical protein